MEKLYEQTCAARPAMTKLAVNAHGGVLPKQLGPPKPPVPGHDVQLTIDIDMQRLAEESLAQGLEAARNDNSTPSKKKMFVAPAGAVVVLDPNDGAVIGSGVEPHVRSRPVRERHRPGRRSTSSAIPRATSR